MDAFQLKVDRDGMAARLVAAHAGVVNAILTPDDLASRLRLEGVNPALVPPAGVEAAFAQLPGAEEGQEFVIARGTPPVHGKNGFVEFLVNVSGRAVYDGASLSDENLRDVDSVDYKNAIKIVSVAAGQPLAIVHPPTEGVTGQTLTGKTLGARNGKAAPLRLGEGVALAADGITAVAQTAGRPVYSNRVLVVSQVYEVAADVCYDTGNINFDGYVHVHGAVQDGFKIEASNIEIDGAVGAATLICRGNLIVHGGVNGKNQARIVCQGNADVKYVSGARFEVIGDLNVAREIANSTVWCRSTVRAGKIMGGEILALRGIEARQVGTDLGTPTLLCPGVNYEVRRLEGVARIVCQNMARLVRDVGPRFGDRRYFLTLPPARQAAIRENYAFFCHLQKAHQRLAAEHARLLANPDSRPQPIVVVLKGLCQDVVIRTPGGSRRFLEGVKGPASFVEDAENHTVKVVPGAPRPPGG